MMTPIVYVGGDPHVMDDAGKLHRQTQFVRGMRFAGCGIKVELNHDLVSS